MTDDDGSHLTFDWGACRITSCASVDVDISINGSVLPADVVAFLREADLKVGQFVRNIPVRVTGFVPSDFVTVYHSL
jgi:hypothetical protein